MQGHLNLIDDRAIKLNHVGIAVTIKVFHFQGNFTEMCFSADLILLIFFKTSKSKFVYLHSANYSATSIFFTQLNMK